MTGRGGDVGECEVEALQDVGDLPDVDRGKVTGSGRVTGTHIFGFVNLINLSY